MSVFPIVIYRDARAGIEFLKRAFGAEEHAVHRDEDGVVAHAELRFGDGLVMSGTHREDRPVAIEPGRAAVYVAVDDVDSHCDRARAAGAEIVTEPADQDYGSRDYAARDPEGNLWSFGTYRPA